MIQNFNDILKNKMFELSGDDSHLFAYSVESATLYLSLDSKGCVFKFFYICHNKTLSMVYELIGHVIKDKDIDVLVNGLGELFYSTYSADELIFANEFEISSSLLNIRKALLTYHGDAPQVSQNDSLSILCRCSKVTFDELGDAYIESKGNYKEIVRALKVGVVCGSCSIQSKNFYEHLEKASVFYKGEARVIWERRVQEAMSDFPLFSPLEFSDVELTLEQLNLPSIKISYKTLKELNIKSAISVLENYLSDSLKEDFKVELVSCMH